MKQGAARTPGQLKQNAMTSKSIPSKQPLVMSIPQYIEAYTRDTMYDVETLV